jgi:phosphoglycerate dehydrogenase-like enzyme
MTSKLVMLPPQNDTTRAWARRLATAVPAMRIVVAEDAATAATEIVDADAAYGPLPPDLLKRATRLRWLQAHLAAPPAGFYYSELETHPVVVTNVREIYSDHIGVQVMAYVLTFARGLHRYHAQQLRREWRQAPRYEGIVHLPEATALVVGVGGIGAECARRLAQFGVRVIGTDARRTAAPPGMAELHGVDALDDLLPRADFVILTVPHTPQTEGFFGRARFQRMKKSAFFINIGRGKTTRLADLTAALVAGEIAGAALDVFEEEPLPSAHALWGMENVIVTPHVAMWGPHIDERRYEILEDNCRRFLAGAPMRNVVDKARWF